MITPTIVDARGLKCPLPVLKAEKALDAIKAGDTVVVLATDPVARIDLVLYCRQKGFAVSVTGDAELRFEIVKL